MVSLDQWRATIGCFTSCRMPKSCMFIKCRSCVSRECVMCVIIVYASIIGINSSCDFKYSLIHSDASMNYLNHVNMARVNAL